VISTMPAPAPPRWRVACVIARREVGAAIRGIGGYIALTVALIAGTWILLVDVRALDADGLRVLADPFRPALTIAMLVLAVFLAVSAAVSVARDRESGTLETLFYGPVDETAYILGKVGGAVAAYVIALPLLLVSLILLSLITGFELTPTMLVGLAMSVLPAGQIVGLGVLLSVGTSRVRTAVLLLISAIAVLLGINVAYSLVQLVPIADPSSSILPLRDALSALETGVRWLSPFAYLERVFDEVSSGAWRRVALGLAIAVVYTAIMIGLAAYWLRRRGVQRERE
jgi:ABC-type transport system involved in multi-copper enzyme maturation permease subunit